MDYLRYYDLESSLFDDVRTRLRRDHTISAFDFFSIVIWKANRAKPAVARRLLKHDPKGRQDLDAIVRDLSKTLATPCGCSERFVPGSATLERFRNRISFFPLS